MLLWTTELWYETEPCQSKQSIFILYWIVFSCLGSTVNLPSCFHARQTQYVLVPRPWLAVSHQFQFLFKVSNILKLFSLNKLQIGIYIYESEQYKQCSSTTTSQLFHTQQRPLCTTLQLDSISALFLPYPGPKVWNSISDTIKSQATLNLNST